MLTIIQGRRRTHNPLGTNRTRNRIHVPIVDTDGRVVQKLESITKFFMEFRRKNIELSFGCRIAGSRERAYMPMPDDAQDWYRSVLDDDGVVRNSVARIEDGVLYIEQGPLVGQEARVKKIDRHKRWCLVDVGEGDSVFRELLPLDVPSKT